MSVVSTYNYDCKSNFTRSVQLKMPPQQEMTIAIMQAGLQKAMEPIIAGQYASAFAQLSGHWFKVNSTTVTVTNMQYNPGNLTYAVAGYYVTNIDTDISDPTAKQSPMSLIDIIVTVLVAVGIALLGAPVELAWAIIVIGIIIAGADTFNSVVATATGAIFTLGGSVGSVIIVIGILAVASLGIYALFFTKKGKQATSKAYKTARGAYRKVRGR